MKNNFVIIGVFIGSISKLFSQGCSDAGICTMPMHHEELTDAKPKNAFEIGYIYGKGVEDVSYNNGVVGYNRTFSDKWQLNTRITYNQAQGNFGTLGQFGDAFLLANYTPKHVDNMGFSYTMGVKIPFSTGNLKINNIALPMDYQPSLGTFDALLGIKYHFKQWDFDAALQLPVLQTNRNSYFDEYSASNAFPTTNLFRRQPDLLLRTTYTFHLFNNRWSFKPNILVIYHLGNDSYEDVFGKQQTIQNSAGLTINTSIITDYKINTNNILKFNVAAPLVIRTIRPDGLTRAVVISLSFQHQF